MIVHGELILRSWRRNIQVMIEGPGHMVINEIAGNMMLEKRLCHGAPFYVLGPLVTDILPGYDHITRRHRRSHRRGQRRRFPLLPHAGRVFAIANSVSHEEGHHRGQDCGTCRRHRQRDCRHPQVGRRDEPRPGAISTGKRWSILLLILKRPFVTGSLPSQRIRKPAPSAGRCAPCAT